MARQFSWRSGAVLVFLALWSGCASDDQGGETSMTPAPTPVPTPAFGLRLEVIAQAADASVLAFGPDGRLFYAEQYTGDIRIISAEGSLLPEPFAHIDVATWLSFAKTDWGLTGLALDPDFETNGYVYAFYSEPLPSEPSRPLARPKLVRFTDQDNRGVEIEVITEDFPESFLDKQGFRTNGSIHFGPDGYLYLTVGDYDQQHEIGANGVPYSQDLRTPLGKILRINKEDGSAPGDNPFVNEPGADPRVFAYGFGHSFHFAFHPATGAIYGNDGTESCEELNLISAGGNYGFPPEGEFPFPDCTSDQYVNAIHFPARPGMQAGQFQSGTDVSGLAFVSEAGQPALGDSLIYCERLTSFMRRLVLAAPNFDGVTADDVVAFDCTGGVAVAPDGTIYYSNYTEIRRLVAGD